jgi:hypothetical protein
VKRRSIVLAIAIVLLCAGVAGAQGEPAGDVPMDVILVHTSDGQGGIDPRARDLDRKLRKQLRYTSMKVLREEHVRLRMGEVHTVKLPDGRVARIQPMHRGEKGVLLAVDVEGLVKTDVRAPNHHTVVIGAGEYEDGHLAIALEPDYAE